MGRSRPLDAEAVRKADDDFYARHPELVKDGKRVKLSPFDPEQKALRQEWWQDYERHAATKPEASDEQSDQNTHKPGQGVVGCPEQDWISIALLSKGDRTPYIGELVVATLTDGSQPKVPLGGAGSKYFSKIPCGSCTFHFSNFYEEIDAWIAEQAG